MITSSSKKWFSLGNGIMGGFFFLFVMFSLFSDFLQGEKIVLWLYKQQHLCKISDAINDMTEVRNRVWEKGMRFPLCQENMKSWKTLTDFGDLFSKACRDTTQKGSAVTQEEMPGGYSQYTGSCRLRQHPQESATWHELL